MAPRLATPRPILQFEEAGFGLALSKVLSPARPLQSEEMLRGREVQMTGIREALYAPGRHVLIYGFRGVGKSSLAQTAAFSLSEGKDPILIGCDAKSTFEATIADIVNEACNGNALLEKKTREVGWNFGTSIMQFTDKTVTHESAAGPAASVNIAVRLIRHICDHHAKVSVIVVDEFDQISDPEKQGLFANFIKQISDKHVPAKFIFCGIGDSIDDLMAAHGSADRYFHTVELPRLPWESRFEIVDVAAQAMGVKIDDDTKIRIARISDGFPHYVHFLTEKLLWRVFRSNNGGTVNAEIFEKAMSDAASSMEMKLRKPYEQATQKYSNDYQAILWAAANGHELRRRSIEIFESYKEIMGRTKAVHLDRGRFNARINSLKQDSHGAILTGTRQGWYEFTEKVVRGYVRLKAEQAGVVLDADHPASPKQVPITR